MPIITARQAWPFCRSVLCVQASPAVHLYSVAQAVNQNETTFRKLSLTEKVYLAPLTWWLIKRYAQDWAPPSSVFHHIWCCSVVLHRADGPSNFLVLCYCTRCSLVCKVIETSEESECSSSGAVVFLFCFFRGRSGITPWTAVGSRVHEDEEADDDEADDKAILKR